MAKFGQTVTMRSLRSGSALNLAVIRSGYLCWKIFEFGRWCNRARTPWLVAMHRPAGGPSDMTYVDVHAKVIRCFSSNIANTRRHS